MEIESFKMNRQRISEIFFSEIISTSYLPKIKNGRPILEPEILGRKRNSVTSGSGSDESYFSKKMPV